MKKTIYILITIFTLSILEAQIPNQFKYQAVLRDASGNVLSNQQVNVEVSILQGGPFGTSVFSEDYLLTTNAQGLININIGSINDLSVIDWSLDTYFIQISADGNIMGTSQLLSVPYALSAQKAENYDEIDPVFTSWDKTSGINITESQIVDFKNYLTTETDPLFTSWDKTSGINITESQIIDLKNYLTTEIDGDVTNEIQDLSLQDNILRITNNDNAADIDLSGYLDNTDSQDLINVLTQGNDAGNKQIKNVANPLDDFDAATKNYIDEMLMQAGYFTVKDFDGNVYKTIKIGEQVWMAEDLRVTHYPNGDPIPNITDDAEWGNLGDNNTDDAYSFYNNDANTDYGALYTYAAAIGDNWQRDNDTLDAEGGQGVCPDGWHLPTDAEFKTLEMYLGMSQTEADGTGWRGGNDEGRKLKETGTEHWKYYTTSTEGTNTTKFTALGGGGRSSSSGESGQRLENGIWWLATEGSTTESAFYRYLRYTQTGVYRDAVPKSSGYSVRCLKN